MIEVFLYMCDGCGDVRGSADNHGSTHVTMCYSCGISQFHNKVSVAQGTNMYKESHFMVEGEGEDDKERQAHVVGPVD